MDQTEIGHVHQGFGALTLTAINGKAITAGDTIALPPNAQDAFNYTISDGRCGGRLKKRRASSLKRNSEDSCSAATEGPCACDTHRGANGQLKSTGMPSLAWIALISFGGIPRALESWARYSASARLSRSMPMAETA